MAALAADIKAEFDPRWEIGLIQQEASAADIYYRGGLTHLLNDGTGLTLTPADADFYAGVVMEHKVVIAADELVWTGTAGRWLFSCAALVITELNKPFAMAQADLFDNPASLNICAAGDPGCVGSLWSVQVTAVNGWVNTDHRSAIQNI